MAIFSNPLFATYTVYARNASIIHLLSLQQSKVCTSQIEKKTTITISFTGLKKLFLSFSPFSLADLMAIFQVDLG